LVASPPIPLGGRVAPNRKPPDAAAVRDRHRAIGATDAGHAGASAVCTNSRSHRRGFLEPLYFQIKRLFQLGPALHMTHIDNLQGICEAAGIRAKNHMAYNEYTNLANNDVQAARASILVPTSGRPLHDYVPLYFGFKTPMVAWNQDHNEHLVFLRFSLDIVARPNIVLCDGNARSNGTRFFVFKTLEDLAQLDPSAINTVKYAHDAELKRRKQAEILVPDFLPLTEALDIMVFSESTRTQVLAIIRRFGIAKAVYVRPGLYFTTQGPTSGT